MENFVDSLLDLLLGWIDPKINAAAGIVVLLVGIVLYIMAKSQSSKGKRVAALICIGAGCLALIVGGFQLLL